jgi:hypothetical protein
MCARRRRRQKKKAPLRARSLPSGQYRLSLAAPPAVVAPAAGAPVATSPVVPAATSLKSVRSKVHLFTSFPSNRSCSLYEWAGSIRSRAPSREVSH